MSHFLLVCYAHVFLVVWLLALVCYAHVFLVVWLLAMVGTAMVYTHTCHLQIPKIILEIVPGEISFFCTVTYPTGPHGFTTADREVVPYIL